MAGDDSEVVSQSTPPPHTPPPPPPVEFHPALSVSNIKNCIPLVLDRQSVQYSNWEELFEVHCHAYNVLDHVDPNTPRPTNVSASLWLRLDSIVKQWIYGTITTNLLQTILSKGDTAQQVWDKLKAIFQDNKTTRALYLEKQLTDIHLNNFPDISSYCTQIKNLKDQLASVDHPVSDKMMVMRLIGGLRNTEFDTVASIIAQVQPLPNFEATRSRLLLEETRCSSDKSPPQSFVAQQSDSSAPPSQPQQPVSRGGSNNTGGRGNNKAAKGRGKGRGKGATPQKTPQQAQASSQPSNPVGVPQWAGPNQQQGQFIWVPGQRWAFPPYPHPHVGQPGQAQQHQTPTAQQAYIYMTAPPSYGPLMTRTDLGNAFSTMTLPSPSDGWYMDSGASSHMTNNPGSTNGENNNEVQ